MDSTKVKNYYTPLTLKQVDSIYWLGRYTERVMTTLKFLMNMYDSNIDSYFDWGQVNDILYKMQIISKNILYCSLNKRNI